MSYMEESQLEARVVAAFLKWSFLSSAKQKSDSLELAPFGRELSGYALADLNQKSNKMLKILPEALF